MTLETVGSNPTIHPNIQQLQTTKGSVKLELYLEALDIPQDVLLDPMFQMMIDEGEGVDGVRYLERKYNKSFPAMDKLGLVSVIESRQYVRPTETSVLAAARKTK